MRNYEKTKYPNIFKNTYWGNFNDSKCAEYIFTNRNKIVEHFKIIKYFEPHPDVCHGLPHCVSFDHLEFYRTKSKYKGTGIVVFSSPYEYVDLSMSEFLGFKPEVEIYLDGVRTFSATYDNINELKHLIKLWNEKKCLKNK